MYVCITQHQQPDIGRHLGVFVEEAQRLINLVARKGQEERNVQEGKVGDEEMPQLARPFFFTRKRGFIFTGKRSKMSSRAK